MLTDKQREIVKHVADGKGTAQELTAVLNELLGQKELHDSVDYAKLSGAHKVSVDALREQLKDKPNEEATRRLNKMLMTGAFDSYFRSPRVNLVSFYNWKPVKVRFQVL